jgi:hypothetical protein
MHTHSGSDSSPVFPQSGKEGRVSKKRKVEGGGDGEGAAQHESPGGAIAGAKKRATLSCTECKVRFLLFPEHRAELILFLCFCAVSTAEEDQGKPLRHSLYIDRSADVTSGPTVRPEGESAAAFSPFLPS